MVFNYLKKYPSIPNTLFVEGSVAAATVLPKSLKFWAPPHGGILLQVILSLIVDHVLSLDILNDLCAACCLMLLVFDLCSGSQSEFSIANSSLMGRCFEGEIVF